MLGHDIHHNLNPIHAIPIREHHFAYEANFEPSKTDHRAVHESLNVRQKHLQAIRRCEKILFRPDDGNNENKNYQSDEDDNADLQT